MVVKATDLDTAKVFHEILLAHEEDTVRFVGPVCKFFGFGGPAVAVVAPVASPFEFAPGIAQLVEPDLVTEPVCDLHAAQQSIGVVSHES